MEQRQCGHAAHHSIEFACFSDRPLGWDAQTLVQRNGDAVYIHIFIEKSAKRNMSQAMTSASDIVQE